PEEKKKLKPKLIEKKPEPKKAAPAEKKTAGAEGLSRVRSDELFEYNYYLRLMTGKISRNWRNPYVGKGDKVLCTIYYQVLRDGTVVGPRVEKSSGASTFDRAALRAVIVSSPLPPLPPDYEEAQLTVHLDFEYIR
ncbi:MAG: TonB family protein, partial [Gemmatimonadota bacterium]|nr:TonB family protein [Gemmatimonadota bacterium]